MRLAGVGKAERRQRAEALLETVHLGGFGEQRPHQLSGGMRQRVAMARAFAQDADILLMDEPFGALDAMTRDALHDELETLARQRGLTVLFVTHNVREAARLGDRIVVLSPRPGRVDGDVRRRHPPSAANRVAGGRRPRRRGHRTAARGGVGPCSQLTTSPSSRERASAAHPADARRGRATEAATARRASVFDATWPKLAAVAIFVLALAVRRLVRLADPNTSCPARDAVAGSLWTITHDGLVRRAVAITFQRAIIGFAASIVIGVAVGLGVASSTIVRRAIGSMITGIQTMPSIAWFPLAIALFSSIEGAIRFVVILGAAPAIANGLITGIDHVPPLLLRAGRVHRRARRRRLSPRHPAGDAPVVRRRAEAGLGVRLAQPDGRRAARHHRQQAVDRAADAAGTRASPATPT